MSGWQRHEGLAVALDLESVDTDQLIPARFMSTPRAAGYGSFLLHDLRHDAGGVALSDAPLNRHPDASVLIARRNFGSGSSREAAVYALLDFGIKAVVAPSFGDIFAANAVNNGLLPARVAPGVAEGLILRLQDRAAQCTVDIASQTVSLAGEEAAFTLDPVWREKLINGWDDIDLTRRHDAEIALFRGDRAMNQAWTFPNPGTGKHHDLGQGTGVGDRRFDP